MGECLGVINIIRIDTKAKMSSESINMEGFQSIKGYLRFFNPLILEIYKSEPDKYEILFDEFEGVLRTKESYYHELERNGQTDNYIHIRFGRITLQNGDIALVIWLPDLLKCSEYHRDKWFGFIIRTPRLSISDPNFVKWYSHNIEALIVKNGPLYELAETVKRSIILRKKVLGDHCIYMK